MTSCKKLLLLDKMIISASSSFPMVVWNQSVLKLIEPVKFPYLLEAAFLDYDKERDLPYVVKKLDDKGIKDIFILLVFKRLLVKTCKK